MNILIIIIGILMAVIIGYCLGNFQRVREEAGIIRKYIEKITKNSEIKIMPKKEPQSEKAEVLEELDKNEAPE